MAVEYRPYRSKRILNVHKHVDGGWFWDKYSAHPYVGCEHGCEFCYSRSRKYLQTDNPEYFSKLIKVKTNAPEQPRKELAKVPCDIIVAGDYQPAEGRFRLSRKMLEVVRSTAEHCGRYVLAGGGLTLDDNVKTRYMKLIQDHFPSLVEKYDELHSSEDVLRRYAAAVGKKIAMLCEKYGVADRIPRYIPDSPLKRNRKISTALFDRVYRLELELESPHKIWAYRKAAWAIEELEENIEELYRSGRLEEVPGVGKTLAAEIEKMLERV